MKNLSLRNLCLAFFLSLGLAFSVPTVTHAQVDNDPPGDPPGDEDVPISGIEWLLLGGGILGARKMWVAVQKKKLP